MNNEDLKRKIDGIVDRCGYEIKHFPEIKQSDIDYYSRRCAEEGYALTLTAPMEAECPQCGLSDRSLPECACYHDCPSTHTYPIEECIECRKEELIEKLQSTIAEKDDEISEQKSLLELDCTCPSCGIVWDLSQTKTMSRELAMMLNEKTEKITQLENDLRVCKEALEAYSTFVPSEYFPYSVELARQALSQLSTTKEGM